MSGFRAGVTFGMGLVLVLAVAAGLFYAGVQYERVQAEKRYEKALEVAAEMVRTQLDASYRQVTEKLQELNEELEKGRRR